MSTTKKTGCERSKCTHNGAQKCNLKNPETFRHEGYLDCLTFKPAAQ